MSRDCYMVYHVQPTKRETNEAWRSCRLERQQVEFRRRSSEIQKKQG